MMSYYGYDGMGFFGVLMMVIFWAAVIGFVWWLAREMRTGSGNRKEMDAMEILKQRYAKGEITKKEFEERKKTLCE